MELAVRTLLRGGTYKIEKTLGQGSFGITYLAEHTSLGRKVAIKEFFMKELNTRGEDGSISGMTDGSLSYNYGLKFKKEAINLSQLDHPNIVRVTNSFEENGTYYYVMDYIEGENLNDYLKHNAVSQQEAVSIITDVAKALQYMHDTKHLLHLDLKPGNIMRRASDGHIFLIDFGLSKHYSNSGQPETSTTIGLGTPGYAPIEQSNQAKNGEFRPTIDVYALGATLYKLLTRETPPVASDIVSDDELIKDKLRANGITGSIIDVVVNAMLPNVKKRTQTVKAFVEALNSNNEPSNTTHNTNSIHVEEVKPANEETCFIGQTNSSTEKLASVKPQAFNIDQYKIPSHYLADPKNTENLAMEGNLEAMFAFAMMYLRGEGKFQNFEVAHKWLHKCMASGDGRAEALLNNWEWLKKKYTKKTTTRPANEEKLTPSEDKKKPKKNFVWGWLVAILIAVVGGFVWFNSTNQSDSTTNMPSNGYVENFYLDREREIASPTSTGDNTYEEERIKKFLKEEVYGGYGNSYVYESWWIEKHTSGELKSFLSYQEPDGMAPWGPYLLLGNINTDSSPKLFDISFSNGEYVVTLVDDTYGEKVVLLLKAHLNGECVVLDDCKRIYDSTREGNKSKVEHYTLSFIKN